MDINQVLSELSPINSKEKVDVLMQTLNENKYIMDAVLERPQ